jgi:alcohol dehydrogenase (cytochrome c)
MKQLNTARNSTASGAIVSALASWLLASTAPAHAADVTYERLLDPEPQNWLIHHGDFNAQRYSPLEVINKSNAKNLKLQFAVALGGKSAADSLEATPLVEDGFMYMVDSWGVVYKIDVRSGTVADSATSRRPLLAIKAESKAWARSGGN